METLVIVKSDVETRLAKIEERLDILFPERSVAVCEHDADGKCIWCPEYSLYAQRYRKRLMLERFTEGLNALSGTVNELLSRLSKGLDT